MPSRRRGLFIMLLCGLLSGCLQTLPVIDQTEPAVKAPPTAALSPVTTAPSNHILPDADLTYAEPADVWQRIREGLSWQIPLEQKRIQQQLAFYQNHPRYLARISDRAAPYLYHIVETIEARGLPMELALLPIVESAYDPFAYSHGRASGLWQFIPGTGKAMGLQQNWWYDGRRDVVASTDAALSYLEQLQKRWKGDWMLALASYNAGAGNVSKAIKRHRRQQPLPERVKSPPAASFWELPLPRETRHYVPKLLALAHMIQQQQPPKGLKPINNEPYFAQVDVGSQIDLAQAAGLAELDIDQLYRLNPGLNRWASPPDGPHHLLVPYASATPFQEKLAQMPSDQRMTWRRYTIQSGDSLGKIAQRYQTTVATLKNVNQLKSHRIRVGKALMIPVASQASQFYKQSADQRLITKQQRSPSKNSVKRQHRVVAGDSLWKIAKRYQTSSNKLAKWNGMAPADPLKPGQTLVVWMPNSLSKQMAQASNLSHGQTRKLGYTVRRGDSLSRIAGRFKLPINDIVRWNQLDKARYLKPGQRLTLFVDIADSH